MTACSRESWQTARAALSRGEGGRIAMPLDLGSRLIPPDEDVAPLEKGPELFPMR